MEAYSVFAQVYDIFMADIPYDEWCDYLTALLRGYGLESGLIAELGCGTGNMTQRLADKGYEMIGIDCSQEMLSEAMKKRWESGRNILYLLQDMRDMELYGTVSAVVSVCDSMNYIIEDEDLIRVFQNVNNYLDAGGIFIFDLKTHWYFKNLLGESTIVEHKEQGSLICDNYYNDTKMLHQYDLMIYAKSKKDKGLYEKWEEQQCQRAYTLERIKSLLAEGGMEFVIAYDAFTKDPPGEDSSRIYVVAKEKTQLNKYYDTRVIKSCVSCLHEKA